MTNKSVSELNLLIRLPLRSKSNKSLSLLLIDLSPTKLKLESTSRRKLPKDLPKKQRMLDEEV